MIESVLETHIFKMGKKNKIKYTKSLETNFTCERFEEAKKYVDLEIKRKWLNTDLRFPPKLEPNKFGEKQYQIVKKSEELFFGQ